VLQPHTPNEPRSPVYSNASLAADGRSVYYLAASQGAKAFDYDVYRLDLGSNAVEKLTTANGYASDLRVSDDGKYAVLLRWTARWGSTPNITKMYLLELATKRVTALNITGTR
jgi:Tol biopolymer transport system component